MLGLKNLSIAGRGGSSAWWDKMWSSYTQLNPGVYSEAIATEFKRRMKPDYVENLVPNGGGLNATDWIDTDSNGLADGFTVINAPTATIETVLCPRGQRITRAGGNAFPSIQTAAGTVSLGVSYTITIRWYSSMSSVGYSNGGARVFSNASGTSFYLTGAANQWNQQTLIYNLQDTTYLSVGIASAIVGDFLIVDSITVSPVVSTNYYNTFGPSGLNKTTADWIYLLTTSGAITSKTIAKSGALLKWNLDGTIVTQNNLPAYTKNTNAGIITATSTDGWSGVTIFNLNANSFTGNCPSFNFPNVTSFNIQGSNFFSGDVPNWIMPKVTTCYFNSNLFSGILPDHNFPLITSYYPSSNAGITGFAGNGVVTNNMSIEISNNMMIPTSGVDARLKAYNDMFAVTPPIKNLTLNLSGATMGIPTGAGSNPDYLGIIAKVQAAGFIPTISTRTS